LWYQSFWFTQILIIAAIILAFYAFVYNKKKRWTAFIFAIFIFLTFGGLSIYIQIGHNKKLARYQTITYRFDSVKDLSDFEADKYSAVVVTDKNIREKQLKELIYKANNQLLSEKKDAKVVWLSLFDSDALDLKNMDKSNPSFIAQTQWTNKEYVGLLPKSFKNNDEYKDIRIYFNQVNEK